MYPESCDFMVTSPYGNNLHHKENATHGQFAFTTSEGGNYLACFTLDGHQEPATGETLSFDWKIGIAAKDWDSVAKKEKVEVFTRKGCLGGYLLKAFNDSSLYQFWQNLYANNGLTSNYTPV
ncbi:PREDICTED: transmembrane emp24 domain-containing protein p24delta5-like [Populus euphratica]|uniref:Transmembrane emp24 domain-containing protein p24delta5-like n=1 Tax=Populus euphratica TaxID=75702 RepID=A0AAJ6TGB0_POPEU|nr:PREDICTED: transmembrane emp24 domain-containing protein p24delta5-like [Populus euphratica]